MLDAAFADPDAVVESRTKASPRSRAVRRWLCHVSVRVAHSCPLLAAGLVATLQQLPGYDVTLSEDSSSTQFEPMAGVHILITDRHSDAEQLDRRLPGSRARARPCPRVVLFTTDQPGTVGQGAPSRRIDACLPMDCATKDLLATVRRLGHAALGPLTTTDHESSLDLPARRGLAPSALRSVRGYIEEHLASGANLESLAQIAGMSSYHFSRAFKQSTGMPPHHYLITRRVSAAIALIRETDRPLSEISLDVGFADQSHFTRTFVQLTGETPGEFRHRSH